MSNPPDPFSKSLNIQIIQGIDDLGLPTIQKHHLKILAHCLVILKEITADDTSSRFEENILKEWCNKQSQRFNDPKFNELLYQQVASTAKKLIIFSENIGKNISDLEIEDLVLLVQKNN